MPSIFKLALEVGSLLVNILYVSLSFMDRIGGAKPRDQVTFIHLLGLKLLSLLTTLTHREDLGDGLLRLPRQG